MTQNVGVSLVGIPVTVSGGGVIGRLLAICETSLVTVLGPRVGRIYRTGKTKGFFRKSTRMSSGLIGLRETLLMKLIRGLVGRGQVLQFGVGLSRVDNCWVSGLKSSGGGDGG